MFHLTTHVHVAVAAGEDGLLARLLEDPRQKQEQRLAAGWAVTEAGSRGCFWSQQQLDFGCFCMALIGAEVAAAGASDSS